MTIEEMKEKIEARCDSIHGCSRDICPLYDRPTCFSGSEEKVKENYKILFGKQSDIFTLSDIQSGYLCKLRNDKLCLVVQTGEDEWTLYDICNEAESGNEDYNDDMIDKEESSKYDIMEVYGYSTTFNLFDKGARKLLFKREEIEDIGKKEYNLSKLKISPNRETYDDKFTECPIFIESNNGSNFISLSIDSAKELIKSLQEIVDYVEGE